MLRRSLSADFSTGAERLQHAPMHYVFTLLGKDGLRGVIFPAEEITLKRNADADLWERATFGVRKVLQRD